MHCMHELWGGVGVSGARRRVEGVKGARGAGFTHHLILVKI